MIKLLSFLTLISIYFFACNNEAKNEKSPLTGELKTLPSPAGTASAEPYLFADDKDNVFLSWIEKKDKESQLKFSMLSNDQWDEPVTISKGTNWFVNWADYPQVAANSNNEMIAHYLEKSGTGTYAYDVKLVASADKGKTWSLPTILHDDGKQAEHGFVSMIPDGENFFVSWLDGRNAAMEAGKEHEHDGHGGAMTLRAATIDKQGKKTNEWELDNRVCDCCQTSAVMTSNGPLVVYRDRSEGEIRDMSIVRLVDNKWTAPQIIHADNWKIEGCPVNGPRVAAKGNTVAVAWFSSPEKKAQVNIIFSNDGGATFNAPVRMDEGEGIGRVDLVMIDEESAIISWMEGADIKAAMVHKDGTKEPSMTIASSSTARSSGFPQLAKAGNHLYFAWADDKSKSIKLASLALHK